MVSSVEPTLSTLPEHDDHRGCFAEVTRESFAQTNMIRAIEGSFRGLHFRKDHTQGKLVTLMSGGVIDYAVCVNPHDPWFGRHWVYSMGPSNQVWTPPGYAHGMFALVESLIVYQSTTLYEAEAEETLFYGDPALGLVLPREPLHISTKDQNGVTLDEIFVS